MKISTGQVFERAVTQMTTQQAKLAQMQTQLASGKQIVQPSDDPDKAAIIQRLNTAYERQEVYETSLDSVNNRLVAEESALMGTDNILQRLRELAVRASSDTLTAGDRKIIAIEVSTLKDAVVALSNTQDITGNYVFSGSMTKTIPFAINNVGNEVFASVVRQEAGSDAQRVSFFSVIDDFISALNNNETAGVQRSLAEVSELSENLSGSLADVGSRMLVVDSQREMLSDAKLRYKTLLSGVEDLDYAKAVTALSAEMLSLEAAQSSFAKISQLSLFNYM